MPWAHHLLCPLLCLCSMCLPRQTLQRPGARVCISAPGPSPPVSPPVPAQHVVATPNAAAAWMAPSARSKCGHRCEAGKLGSCMPQLCSRALSRHGGSLGGLLALPAVLGSSELMTRGSSWVSGLLVGVCQRAFPQCPWPPHRPPIMSLTLISWQHQQTFPQQPPLLAVLAHQR